jgi:hypothetical protein
MALDNAQIAYERAHNPLFRYLYDRETGPRTAGQVWALGLAVTLGLTVGVIVLFDLFRRANPDGGAFDVIVLVALVGVSFAADAYAVASAIGALRRIGGGAWDMLLVTALHRESVVFALFTMASLRTGRLVAVERGLRVAALAFSIYAAFTYWFAPCGLYVLCSRAFAPANEMLVFKAWEDPFASLYFFILGGLFWFEPRWRAQAVSALIFAVGVRTADRAALTLAGALISLVVRLAEFGLFAALYVVLRVLGYVPLGEARVIGSDLYCGAVLFGPALALACGLALYVGLYTARRWALRAAAQSGTQG